MIHLPPDYGTDPIDLQKGIVGFRPHLIPVRLCRQGERPGPALPSRQGTCWCSSTSPSRRTRLRLEAPVDRPPQLPPGGFPEAGANCDAWPNRSNMRITSANGRVYGTELDLQLRRRGVTSVVIGGHRHQHRRGVDRAGSARARLCRGARRGRHHGRSAEMHAFALGQIFPMLGRIAKGRRDRASGMSEALPPALASLPLQRLPTAGRWAVLLAALPWRGGLNGRAAGGLMLGPLAAAVLVQTGRRGEGPALLAAAQTIIGCLVARSITPSIVGGFVSHWPVFLGVVGLSVVGSAAIGWAMSRLRIVSGTTAVWGCFPAPPR